jgi:gliding motility-associated-like protein
VKAIDRISGCESGLVTVDILDQRVYPQIAIETSPARCDMNDGIAYLEVQNDVPIDYVTWVINGFEFYDDVSLFEIGPGDHQVTVVSDMACATSETFTLDGTIIVYNGISANGDGVNDFMKLGCIENYGSNYVQIFNRSGMVVYEAENYDNLTKFFDGHGNQGMYVGEKDLPSGTYFYIIDLKDGNEPLRGFLELVRP